MARAVAAIPALGHPQTDQPEEESWEHIGSKTCGKACHLPSSADNGVTMELATINEKWRRRGSNPQTESCNSEVAQRLWNMLQDVGVSWEYTGDTNRHPLTDRKFDFLYQNRF